MSLLSLLSHRISLVESLSLSLTPPLRSLRLPSRIAQRLQRGVAVLNPHEILCHPEQHTLNDSQLELLRLHLLCDDTLDAFQLLQTLVVQKYTQERDKQRLQRQSKETTASSSSPSSSQLSEGEQHCDQIIAKKVNSEGLERGPPSSSALLLTLFPSGAEDPSTCLPHELWFQVLLDKYQSEFGELQHDCHDTDLLLGLLLAGPPPPPWSTGSSSVESGHRESIEMTLTSGGTSAERTSDDSSGGEGGEGGHRLQLPVLPSVNLRSSHSVRRSRPPLGIFCVFLACCLVGEIDCTAREWDSLLQVPSPLLALPPSLLVAPPHRRDPLPLLSLRLLLSGPPSAPHAPDVVHAPLPQPPRLEGIRVLVLGARLSSRLHPGPHRRLPLTPPYMSPRAAR
jgi:hypothetical protein